MTETDLEKIDCPKCAEKEASARMEAIIEKAMKKRRENDWAIRHPHPIREEIFALLVFGPFIPFLLAWEYKYSFLSGMITMFCIIWLWNHYEIMGLLLGFINS